MSRRTKSLSDELMFLILEVSCFSFSFSLYSCYYYSIQTNKCPSTI
jgi:hypothetical protein